LRRKRADTSFRARASLLRSGPDRLDEQVRKYDDLTIGMPQKLNQGKSQDEERSLPAKKRPVPDSAKLRRLDEHLPPPCVLAERSDSWLASTQAQRGLLAVMIQRWVRPKRNERRWTDLGEEHVEPVCRFRSMGREIIICLAEKRIGSDGRRRSRG
jgi:hypothetical protein